MPKGIRQTAFYVITTHPAFFWRSFPDTPQFRKWVKSSKVKAHEDKKKAKEGFATLPDGAEVLILKAKPVPLATSTEPVLR